MLFNSLHFLVFFLVVTLWFFRLRTQRTRIALLLTASCYFYMSFIPIYVLILGATIVIDYFAGIYIAGSAGTKRKVWLIASLVANIGILVVFKYYNFFIDNITKGFLFWGKQASFPLLEIALPIGLSFHTFQAMSYTIEVYRGNQQPERNFITYALYVMFYPQLVAGPIERPQNILPQLNEYRSYNWDNVKEGIARMLWGFFKKVVIADRLAIVVDYTFANHPNLSGSALFVGAVLYSFQIYCDFSGYSDIALGSARVMNIRLMENFDQPYLARNISGFWSRWHISLSTWFRDYLYIPLGGNRKGETRRKINVFIVFVLSGLWHGANKTFILWGFLHGLLVTFFPGKVADRFRHHETRRNYLKIGWITVNFLLVTICWVFFRARTIHEAVAYLKRIFTFKAGINEIGLGGKEFVFSILLIIILLCRERLKPGHFIQKNKSFYWYVALMVFVCYFFGVFTENQFIYFQF